MFRFNTKPFNRKFVRNVSGWSFIAGITATVGGICMPPFFIIRSAIATTERNRNKAQEEIKIKNHNFFQSEYDYNRTKSVIDDLNVSKCSLYTISNDKKVFDAWDTFFEKYLQSGHNIYEDDLNHSQIMEIAKKWYKKYQIIDNMSLDEKRNNSDYQIVISGIILRANFIKILDVLERYKWERSKGEKIISEYNTKYGKNFKVSEFLSLYQAERLLNRYHRFIKIIKPFDDVSGFGNDTVYEHQYFFEALSDCFTDENDKNVLKKQYDKFILENV